MYELSNDALYSTFLIFELLYFLNTVKANLNYSIKIVELFLFLCLCVENMRNLTMHYDLYYLVVYFI